MTAPRPPRPAARPGCPLRSANWMDAAVRRCSPATPILAVATRFPNRSQSFVIISPLLTPTYSSAAKNSTLSFLITIMENPSSSGLSSKTRALIPSRASFWETRPPLLLSLIPPVNGDFPPTESRPELAAGEPDNNPGAKTSLLYLLKGWQVAGTSFKIIFDVRARPPSPAISSAGVSNE